MYNLRLACLHIKKQTKKTDDYLLAVSVGNYDTFELYSNERDSEIYDVLNKDSWLLQNLKSEQSRLIKLNFQIFRRPISHRTVLAQLHIHLHYADIIVWAF